jgi:hypothetical protein
MKPAFSECVTSYSSVHSTNISEGHTASITCLMMETARLARQWHLPNKQHGVTCHKKATFQEQNESNILITERIF